MVGDSSLLRFSTLLSDHICPPKRNEFKKTVCDIHGPMVSFTDKRGRLRYKCKPCLVRRVAEYQSRQRANRLCPRCDGVRLSQIAATEVLNDDGSVRYTRRRFGCLSCGWGAGTKNSGGLRPMQVPVRMKTAPQRKDGEHWEFNSYGSWGEKPPKDAIRWMGRESLLKPWKAWTKSATLMQKIVTRAWK